MPQKKRGNLAAFRRKKKRISIPKPNPPLGDDVMEFIIPGFVAYAGTRFLARIVHSMAKKRFPKGGKHLAAGSAVVAAGGTWLLAHRFERVAKYHTPAVVGASIAAMQTVVQTYLPKYGWMVGDLDNDSPAAKALPEPTNAQQQSLPPAEDDFNDIDVGGGSLGSGALQISDGDLSDLEAMI